MGYDERATAVTDAVLWQQGGATAPQETLILPDGCLDVIWDGARLFVAGPDTTARRHRTPAGTMYVGLRFSGGLGAALLGVAADELRDQTPALDELWPAGRHRRLVEEVAADPSTVLPAWALGRSAHGRRDPFGARILAMARVGTPVAEMADRLGMSTRQLHRRCLPTFGYGPRHLTRVLRLGRAVDAIRAGAPLARVAADHGYADQAHLSRDVRDLTGTTPGALRAP